MTDQESGIRLVQTVLDSTDARRLAEDEAFRVYRDPDGHPFCVFVRQAP
ncbi:hypothetical protein AB0E27_12420 [Streptomyces sparsogenes]